MGPDAMDPMDPSVKIVIAMLARRFMRLRRAYAYEGGRDRVPSGFDAKAGQLASMNKNRTNRLRIS